MKISNAIRNVEFVFINFPDIASEETIESFEIAVEAMNKQDPMKPVKEIFGNYDCPVCNAYVEFSGNQSYYKHDYCPYCGQAIDWEE